MTVIWASLHFAICIHLVVVCTLHHVVYTSPFYILQHILHFAPFSCNLTSSLSVLHFALCIISLHLQVLHFIKHSVVCIFIWLLYALCIMCLHLLHSTFYNTLWHFASFSCNFTIYFSIERPTLCIILHLWVLHFTICSEVCIFLAIL